MSRKPRGYWTYEKCKEEVDKYKTVKEFRSSKAYQIILRNKWGELLDTLDYIQTPQRNIKYDEIKKIALGYSSYNEFIKSEYNTYYIIQRRGWCELTDHMERVGNLRKRLIYVYEFGDNSVYIGLTYNINNRKDRHSSNPNSAVYKYVKKTNLTPIVKLISDYIDSDEAILLEGDTLEKYKENGWNILNSAKTGGLGGNIIKWTYDACLDEIKKYNNLKDFRLKSSGAYNSIRRNKWIDILDKYYPNR
jgi:predicted GIY-YIG superfamily endonuclease